MTEVITCAIPVQFIWPHVPPHLARVGDSKTNCLKKHCNENKLSNWRNKSCKCRIPVDADWNLPIDINLDKFARTWQSCTLSTWENAQTNTSPLLCHCKYITSHIMHRLASGTWLTNVFVWDVNIPKFFLIVKRRESSLLKNAKCVLPC